MRALRNHAPLVDDDDTIGALHGRQAVRNDQRGVLAGEALDGIGNQHFAFGVESAGGFIKQQHRAVRENGAGDGDALPLTARQTHAAFAEFRLKPVRQRAGEFRHVRRIARGAYVSVGRL